MEKNLYKKDIWNKSLSIQKEKSDIRSGAMNIFIGAIILLFILIFPFTHFIKGNETIPIWLWGIFGGDIAALIGSIFSPYILAFFDMWKVAAEEHNKQEEIIKNLEKTINPEQLPLLISKIEDQPNIHIVIENFGKNKIVELESKIGFVYKFWFNENKEILERGWRIYSHTINNMLDQSAIRPKDLLSSGTIISYSDKYSKVKFGESQNYDEIGLGEVIYTVHIKLDGRIEGEVIFKNKYFEVDIYAKSSEKILCFARHASENKLISRDFENKYLEYREKQREKARKYKRDKKQRSSH